MREVQDRVSRYGFPGEMNGLLDKVEDGLYAEGDPFDQAALLHPAEVVREATAVPPDLRAELPGPEEAAGGLRQRMEHLVVRPRQPGVAHELLLQKGVEVLVHVQIRLPQKLLAVVEPSRFGHTQRLRLC